MKTSGWETQDCLLYHYENCHHSGEVHIYYLVSYDLTKMAVTKQNANPIFWEKCMNLLCTSVSVNPFIKKQACNM